jgi:hypothetical protein
MEIRYISRFVFLVLLCGSLTALGNADPPRLVTFFFTPLADCPGGWQEVVDARGRLVMATTDPAHAGKVWGQPFRPAQPPEHRHSTTFELPYDSKNLTEARLSYVAHGGRPAVFFLQPWRGIGGIPKPSPVVSGPSTLELPYMQMVVCEKTDPDDAALDTLPPDTVAYFSGAACPARPEGFEWEPYQRASGRFIVPLAGNGQIERTVNEPWSQPPAPHHHAGMVDLPARDIGGDGKTYCGIWCGLSYFERPGRIPVGIHAAPSDAEPFAYMELMACRKTGRRQKTRPFLPPLITFFTTSAECPGYQRLPTAGGRFLVGLPEGAEPNRAFGTPLKDGESRAHTHPTSFALTYQNVSTGQTGDLPRLIARLPDEAVDKLPPGGPAVPYIQLTQCWWKCPVCGPTSSDERGE